MKKFIDPEAVFEKLGGIANAKHLLEEGITYYHLQELLDSGQIIKLKRGLYRWSGFQISEMAEVTHIVKQGVFCLFSAAAHLELTTFVSSEYHVAVPKKHKVVLPEYPPIRLYYWDQTAFQTGVVKVTVQDALVDMYDAEKTVCDMIRYQKKVGMDTLKEVLNSYLHRKNRNLEKLGQYASILNMKEEVQNLITLLV